MATKKSQSINSQLISGAYKAARSGGYQKSNFKLDLDGVADMLTAKAAANQKLQEEAEEMLDFQPALGKIGENDQGPLLNYFSGVKNEMADIHTEMQGADQETRIRLQGELARLKQTALTVNDQLTQRSQISEDYAEAIDKRELTGAMDPVRRAQLNKIHIEKNFELILENGQTSYKLPDGSILTNKEANDFKLKAFDQQKAITELSENFFKDGFQGRPLAPDALDMTHQSLMKNLTKEAMESLKSDKLLGDQDVIIDTPDEYARINAKWKTNYKVGDVLEEEHERWGMADNIVGHLKKVHASGTKDYQAKQSLTNNPSAPRVKVGEIQQFAGRNGVQYIWYPELGGYGVAQKQPDGGYGTYDKGDTKYYPKDNAIIKNPNILNMQMVGDKVQFEN